MKLLSENEAIKVLLEQKKDFTRTIVSNYEHRAKNCSTCDTPGLCCTDEHFVNVHITRLEARQINRAIETFSDPEKHKVKNKISNTIKRYGLSDKNEPALQTYSCPMYEKSVGCIIHNHGKPLPCIVHACYENKADLPPDELLEQQEADLARLNKRVYGNEQNPLPLPVALLKFSY